MSTAILTTKLYIPPPNPNHIYRTRLFDRLNRAFDAPLGTGYKLTLISAPAGFGKSSLMNTWIATHTKPVAWLALEEADGEPMRFLTYLVAALQRATAQEGTFGARTLAMLESAQLPPLESILTTLINECATLSTKMILVLDDYHLLDAPPLDQSLTFLLDHLPPQLHLVITTREDPNLPLARYRARGQLTEIRAADLRFTPAEAAEFLNRVMGLSLSAESLMALDARTEGWIAGLQLAALSLQGHVGVTRTEEGSTQKAGGDAEHFIAAFTGSHRFVLDYLVEEVLQQQPADIRDFLLQTAILDRLNGSLCDAVTERQDSAALLALLERANLFVIPLDDERRWYRYHHLFADMLRARAQEQAPTQVAAGHLRASQWHEQHHDHMGAIHHALAAPDHVRAATLIERIWPSSHRNHLRSLQLLRAFAALPNTLFHHRPVLSLGYGWELLNEGKPEAAEAYLQLAEQWLDSTATKTLATTTTGASASFVDTIEFRQLPAEIAAARAYHAMATGNVAATITYAQRALACLPADAYTQRGPAAALLGLAYWATGELEAAHNALAEAMSDFQKDGKIVFAISGTYGLADIRLAQGQLRAAIHTYQTALELASAHAPTGTGHLRIEGKVILQGTTDLHMGLGMVYHEQGNQEAATEHLQRAATLGEQAAITNWPHRWAIAQAECSLSANDPVGALAHLADAERRYIRGPVPETRPITALKARAWLAQGRLDLAHRWAVDRGLSIHDPLTYLREFEHITLARLLLAEYQGVQRAEAIDDALDLLARLLDTAETGERWGSAIEILIVQALAQAAHNNIPAALRSLTRALILAEPEGYCRIFVDEGAPMAALLQAAVAAGIQTSYAQRLLATLRVLQQPPNTTLATVPAPLQHTPAHQPLIEPLSERELEVLALVAEGFSNQEIAERLVIALSTVKGHNRVIFGKLQVHRRTEAVARARALGLV